MKILAAQLKARSLVKLDRDSQGFVTLLIALVLILGAALFFVYLRVLHTSK